MKETVSLASQANLWILIPWLMCDPCPHWNKTATPCPLLTCTPNKKSSSNISCIYILKVQSQHSAAGNMKLLLLSELVHSKTLQQEAGSENVCALNTNTSLRNVAEKIRKSLRSSVLSTSQNVCCGSISITRKGPDLQKNGTMPCISSSPVVCDE